MWFVHVEEEEKEEEEEEEEGLQVFMLYNLSTAPPP